LLFLLKLACWKHYAKRFVTVYSFRCKMNIPKSAFERLLDKEPEGNIGVAGNIFNSIAEFIENSNRVDGVYFDNENEKFCCLKCNDKYTLRYDAMQCCKLEK
jgi:hypothetical protein